MKKIAHITPVITAFFLGLVGCGGGGGSGSASTGQIKLAVTDAPVDEAAHVFVSFTGLELKPQGGDPITIEFDTPKFIDLLALNGGNRASLLDATTVPAGPYNYIRLDVATDEALDTYIELDDGSQHELSIPSGDQSGLKLVSGFTVAAGGITDFTIDFDLRKAVTKTGNPNNPAYKLRPALRIVDNSAVGTVKGTVSAGLANATGCSPVIYVFNGADTTPADISGASTDPLTTTTVRMNTSSGAFEYTAAFLNAGTYTLSFTCDGLKDTPEAVEALAFQGTQNVTVIADQTATVNFP